MYSTLSPLTSPLSLLFLTHAEVGVPSFVDHLRSSGGDVVLSVTQDSAIGTSPEMSDTNAQHEGQVVPFNEPSSTSSAVEVARRAALMEVIANDSHPYSVQENYVIAAGTKRMDEFINNPKKQKVRNKLLSRGIR
jgi:hypothetical protein